MAKKKYKEDYSNEKGVWRTIGGRRVFIKEGQSLSDAMVESGKFGKREARKKEEQEESLDDWRRYRDTYQKSLDRASVPDSKERFRSERDMAQKEIDRIKDEMNYYDNPEAYNGNMSEKLWEAKHIKGSHTYGQKTKELLGDKIENKEDYIKKNRDLEEAKKRVNEQYAKDMEDARMTGNDRLERSDKEARIEQLRDIDRLQKENLDKFNKDKEYELYKKARENEDSIDPMTENSTDWEALDKKYRDRYDKEFKASMGEVDIPDDFEAQFNDYVKENKSKNNTIPRDFDKITYTQKIQTNAGEVGDKFELTKDEYGDYHTKNLRTGETYQANMSMLRSSEAVQFENVEKRKMGNDYLPKATKITTQGTSNRKEVSDNIQAHILDYYDNPVDFMEQMDNMDYYPTKWRAGEEMARGGSYAIYYDDQREFLDSLGINPKGKSFSDDRVFQTYTSLIGRESERLYNRMEKLYEQYKKEHKGSDVSLDDFRKWFKK